MREIRMRCLAVAMMAALASYGAAAQTGTNHTTETRVETRAIPFKITYEFSRTVGTGRLIASQKGKPGEVIHTYAVSLIDGKPVSRSLVSTQRVEPTNEVILMGTQGFATSRHKFLRSKVLSMVATAYPALLPGRTGHTATGMRAGYGVVAVDPRVIRLGTWLYVEGYGFAIAADTGGAIKGRRIDVCFPEVSTCYRFGRRTVKVHVLAGY